MYVGTYLTHDLLFVASESVYTGYTRLMLLSRLDLFMPSPQKHQNLYFLIKTSDRTRQSSLVCQTTAF
jgi:hypothetical protein